MLFPYTSKQHTFLTKLAIAECVERLREHEHNPDLLSGENISWRSLATGQHIRILCKVDNQHFKLLPVPSGRFNWLFFGNVSAQQGKTTITGQYRLDMPSKLGWIVVFGGGLFGIGALLLTFALTLVRGSLSMESITLLCALPIGALLFMNWHIRDLNKAAKTREKETIQLLEQLLEAHEVTR